MEIFALILRLLSSLISSNFQTQNPPTITPTPIISTTPTNTISLSPTQTPSPKPTIKPTNKPTPTSTTTIQGGATVTSSDTCPSYNFTAPSSSIKVIIKPSSNQNDGKLKLVEIRSPGCSTMNNKSTDKQVKNTFGNEVGIGSLYPGNYKIRVAHGTGLTYTSEYSVSVNSGQTSTVEVSIP